MINDLTCFGRVRCRKKKFKSIKHASASEVPVSSQQNKQKNKNACRLTFLKKSGKFI